ncbi:hypothetical protein [Priestia megaterium]|uniref:hypothetical protein n=1 Tax=Priestia megaterium TaxID=1404 RepID=UPI000BF657B4|nr:hypothetical protein [Priestia megaterium]PFR94855.1 hypothetical protein COK39_15080 [Priestia megaterium]
MNFKSRLNKAEKQLPASQTEEKLDEISCWLIENNKEFQDGIRRMFRLQCQAEKSVEHIHDWDEPLRQEYLIVIHSLERIKQSHMKEGNLNELCRNQIT